MRKQSPSNGGRVSLEENPKELFPRLGNTLLTFIHRQRERINLYLKIYIHYDCPEYTYDTKVTW